MCSAPTKTGDKRAEYLELAQKVIGTVQNVITVVSGLAALPVTISPWTNHTLTLFYDHPYEVIVILWAFSVAGVVSWIMRNRKQEHRAMGDTGRFRRARMRLVSFGMLVTALSTFSYWYVYHLKNTPAPYRPQSAWAPSFELPATGADTPSPTATASIALAAGASSLHQRSGSLFMVEPDPDIAEKLAFKKGREDDDPTYYPRIRAWLKDRAVQVGKPQDRLFLTDDVNLVTLTYDHSNIVNDLRPATQAEFDTLPPAQQEIVGRWLTHYVGQWELPLRVSVDNTQGKRKFLVKSLTVHVTAIKECKGVAPKLLALRQIAAVLPFKKGDTVIQFLESGTELEVPAGGSPAFNVLITPAPDAPLLPQWDGDMTLNTSLGPIPLGKFVLATYNTRRQAGPTPKK